MEFTHFDSEGNARMVDVGGKEETKREATARGKIYMSRQCLDMVTQKTVAKGDVLGVARVAGIMGAKRTADLIPLCHVLNLTKLTVDFQILEEECAIEAICTARTTGRTGVEMEALTGVSAALLTIYDMCKAVDRAMELGHAAGMKICLDMASYNIVEADRDFLRLLVDRYVDILFANEDEARAFTCLPEQEAIDDLARRCEVAVVKVGPRGAYIRRGEEQVHVPAKEVPEAIEKATLQAKKNLINVPMLDSTIPHEVHGRFGRGYVYMMPAAEGTGVIAGGPVRAVMEAAGIKDIRTKSHGTSNPVNCVKATIAGLAQLRTAEQVAALRGKTVEEIIG